jgi:flotillin
MNAEADSERIRLIGASEASAIEAVGKAEAERMKLKASAYKQYGEAAMLSLVLETLPKVCLLS